MSRIRPKTVASVGWWPTPLIGPKWLGGLKWQPDPVAKWLGWPHARRVPASPAGAHCAPGGGSDVAADDQWGDEVHTLRYRQHQWVTERVPSKKEGTGRPWCGGAACDGGNSPVTAALQWNPVRETVRCSLGFSLSFPESSCSSRWTTSRQRRRQHGRVVNGRRRWWLLPLEMAFEWKFREVLNFGYLN
jgi:hypothetical protein